MKKKVILIAIAICILAIASAFFILGYTIYRPVSFDHSQVFFEVKDGQKKTEISEGLKEKNLIRSAKVMAYYAKAVNANLKSGLYYFSPSQSTKQIVAILSRGDISEKQITIVEGLRREEIAQYLDKNNIVKYKDFMQASDGKEGFLFPDTYRISASSSANEIVKKMTDNFEKKAGGEINRDILSLASIVEREAKKDDERAKIAGVYQNRLNVIMKLEADPTVQYGKDTANGKNSLDFKYWQAITFADYTAVDSKFNTYVHSGLPPAPICNPGTKSIDAAKNPAKHNYYYFFHLKSGEAIFSKNSTEHNSNKVKYQNER
ncbi:endolytic transglycosylase MltG [Candidatus Berkelbacteria bacterium CG_4_9_14_3_um_filter_39_23]|uniref:Endolytic murein transglycosylase n=2 Tax=Candidatus Berkelbacteria TaxID=1618330 RepID=A0A2M7CIU6_9BACT|nr:MAG: hypothetical protein AUK14_02380 [Candidatus Berkelbacteria bacterium CG2_30_39_44]PIR27603.1 MAG: hypothetical protein COV39_03600 [Candidatus Berkelbacteria bacterium CG11_big_fil_rev_8_21_14_0_20_40_23]PIV25562.1 MAG: endolytic transglycosylase MltG [Candidatus Berkelbacteria bacterium CG03_land_8_20_14_0_80_40_36]PIZ29209.1 MAG: endolytic transglycosylase MltG [Candidatus Berkelbacteria bacterium CG_4_10_14_0_8_um_filter_39_42]PJB51333.1 MAG: endolytic transglycosylase MltG [Candida